MKLGIIVASTRPTRIGHLIGQWAHERAIEHGKFDIELLDLAKFHLPLYDEPKHPSLQQYEHDHTKRWSASVASADGVVIVNVRARTSPSASAASVALASRRDGHIDRGAAVLVLAGR
jgi:NAD(P)H-dependent FMN reductase